MATLTIPTSFLYQNATVCTSSTVPECVTNATLAKKYQQLLDTLSSHKSKNSDMHTLYGRELAYTFNMVVGCIGLGLYIKWNQ
jgi:hypothetical protein